MSSAPLSTSLSATLDKAPNAPGMIDEDISSLMELIESPEFLRFVRSSRTQNVASRPTDVLRKFLAEFDAAFDTKWARASQSYATMHDDIVGIIVNICANVLAAEDGTLSLNNIEDLSGAKGRTARLLWELLSTEYVEPRIEAVAPADAMRNATGDAEDARTSVALAHSPASKQIASTQASAELHDEAEAVAGPSSRPLLPKASTSAASSTVIRGISRENAERGDSVRAVAVSRPATPRSATPEPPSLAAGSPPPPSPAVIPALPIGKRMGASRTRKVEHGSDEEPIAGPSSRPDPSTAILPALPRALMPLSNIAQASRVAISRKRRRTSENEAPIASSSRASSAAPGPIAQGNNTFKSTIGSQPPAKKFVADYPDKPIDPNDPKEKTNCVVCGRAILAQRDQGHEHRKSQFVSYGPGTHSQAGCPAMRACGASFFKAPQQAGRYVRFERLALWILFRRPEFRALAPNFEDDDQFVGMIQRDFKAWWKTVPTLHGFIGPGSDTAFKQKVQELAAAL